MRLGLKLVWPVRIFHKPMRPRKQFSIFPAGEHDMTSTSLAPHATPKVEKLLLKLAKMRPDQQNLLCWGDDCYAVR